MSIAIMKNILFNLTHQQQSTPKITSKLENSNCDFRLNLEKLLFDLICSKLSNHDNLIRAYKQTTIRRDVSTPREL